MKKYIYITFLFLMIFSCNTYKPTYDLGNYNYTLTGIRNNLNGEIIVKVHAKGTTYDEIRQNALKNALNDVFLKGITLGPKDCLKLPLFQNRQDNPATTEFLQNFFADENNIKKYAQITREFGTWEEKRDLKYTQNQALAFEVALQYSALENLAKQTKNN